MSSKTIAIDFDGVIHQYDKGWDGGNCDGLPVPGAFAAITRLRKRGYEVYVLTARPVGQAGTWFLKNWTAANGAEGDIPEISNTKKPAIAYIDDRGLRFTNWFDMLNYF